MKIGDLSGRWHRRNAKIVCAVALAVYLFFLWTAPAESTIGEENDAEQFAEAVRNSNFPQSEWVTVVMIARCESAGTFSPTVRGDMHLPAATDGLGSIGAMQINAGNLYGRHVHPALRTVNVDNHHADAVVAWLSDTDNNLHAAWLIWAASGWREWACSDVL